MLALGSASQLQAQPAFLRPDDEDFRIIPPPVEVVTWSLGAFAVGKVSANTTTSTGDNATSLPHLFFPLRRVVVGRMNEPILSNNFGSVDIRPVVDYGLTFSAPILFTLFGRNWGINIDAYLASYRYVTQYLMTGVLTYDYFASFRDKNIAINGNGTAAFSSEFHPKFVTTFRTLNIAPMLNISGFLVGANIGIPMPFMESTLTTPNSAILPLRETVLPIDRRELQISIEPRIGFSAPLVTTRSGSLNFLASVGWMLPATSPLRGAAPATQELMQRSNQIFGDAVRSWMLTTIPTQTPPMFRYPLEDQGVTPLSISIGFNYLFTFGNGAIIDAFEKDAYDTDSLRAVYAAITRRVDSLRSISTRLADTMVNRTIVSMRLRDSLARLQRLRAIDSTNRAQEQRLFAERERRDAVEAEKQALLAMKRDLEEQKRAVEEQKRALETSNKRKDKELLKKNQELAEQQRQIEEKQRQLAANQRLMEDKNKEIEETKKRVFEAKIGAITALNSDGSRGEENPTINVEEFTAVFTKTLIPRVFFDKGSTLIPARYKQIAAADRTTYAIPTSPSLKATQIHAHVLNIIAKRLLENPTAQLTLTGFKRDDETDPKLPLKRAEAIATYFIDRWKIPSARLVREAGKPLPASSSAVSAPMPSSNAAPTNTEIAKAMSVLITSNNPSICAAFVLQDTTRVARPAAVAIDLDITTGAGLKQWQFEARQIINNEDELLTDTSGTKNTPRIVWNLEEDAVSVPRSSNPVALRLEAFDIKNSKAPESPIRELNVEQLRLKDKQLRGVPERTVYFYDIVFEQSVTNFAAEQERLVSEIKSRLQANSSVKMQLLNPQKASGTAVDVAQLLGIETGKAQLSQSASLLNPGQTPEAGAYNSVIRLRIETPEK